jgi:hypothetical protein
MTTTLPAIGVLPHATKHAHIPYHKFRVLLSLDGGHLSPLLLSTVPAYCVPFTDRLDILLVNPPKSPPSLLAGLLMRLEHSGIDYRLVSCDGELGEQVLDYLKRFAGITMVLVDNLSSLEQSIGSTMAKMRKVGYRFESINVQSRNESGNRG